MAEQIFTPAAIVNAHEKIKKHINWTPLLASEVLDQIASHPNPEALLTGSEPHQDGTTSPRPPRLNLFFKCENLQRTGAFKARGAFFALLRLADTHGLAHMRAQGVITVSSGNHAQGLALAAATLGVPALIVMPRTSTASKIAGVARTLGIDAAAALHATAGADEARGIRGSILFCGASNAEKKTAAADAAARTGSLFVPPYDHADVILGQGTCAKELDEQFAERCPGEQLSAVVAPIGGGGLLGGVATWFGDRSETKVFGAEPSFQGADDARRGLQKGARIEQVSSGTIADGLRTPVGVTNWGIVSDKSKVEGVFAVGEEEIKVAMKLLLENLKIVVEPSGCVPLAAVLFNTELRRALAAHQPPNEPLNLVIVLSGGNTTTEAINELLGGLEAPKSKL
jgi:threonine dehydratase